MKRIFDITVSIIALLILSPLFVFISIAVKLDSKGDIFYLGLRTGKKNKNFYIYKFRTMIQQAEDIGGPSTALNDFRLTNLGRFLRKFKLDELPQFMNIIKGDMSLVGPRPQVNHYTRQYTGEFKLILNVRPGLTDLASLYFHDMDQILGTKNVDEKYANEIEPIKNLLRLKYVKEQNFFWAQTFFKIEFSYYRPL